MTQVPDGSMLFVLPCGKCPENTSETLQAAFDLASKEQLEPIWISTDQCLDKSARSPTEVYVCDPFHGPAFEHLTGLNCRVMGPLCVMMCIQEQHSLPRRPNPLYSLSFRNTVVTCSVLEKEERARIKTRIELMGGTIVAPLTTSVTHVVAGEVGSKKYHVAANQRLPVMRPEWVDLFWEREQYTLAHATSANYNHLRLPALKGLVITVSQVPFQERKELQKLIESNGGTYSGTLHCNKTTHVALLEAVGTKYQHARSWQLHCVQVRWIHESIRAGYALDESLYAIEPKGGSGSTPVRMSEVPGPSWDASIIVPRDAPPTVNETACSNISIASCREAPRDPVDDIDMEQLSVCCGQLLDGCCVLLWGFSSDRLDKMRRVINACGGVRLNEYTEEVTHVIAAEGKDLSELSRVLTKWESFPYVVSPRWFAESCVRGKAQDIDAYLVLEQEPKSCSTNGLLANLSKHSVEKARQKTVSVTSDLEHTVLPDLSDIVNQYRASPNSSSLEKFRTSLPNETGRLYSSVTTTSKENASRPVETVVNEGRSYGGDPKESWSPNRQITLETLFDLMTFRIHDFNKEDEPLLEEMIVQNGGRVIRGPERKPDSGHKLVEIVPLVVGIEKDYSHYGGLVVTYCWLQSCIHEEALLPFDADPLFRPFRKSAEKEPLRGCVVSFSQYNTPERDFLVDLAKSLGAVCQEFLARKESKQRKLLANTHLVAREPEGVKYEAAMKWGLHVVTRDWLVATAGCGDRLPEEEFWLDKAKRDMCNVEPQAPDIAVSQENLCSAANGNHVSLDLGVPANCVFQHKTLESTPKRDVLLADQQKDNAVDHTSRLGTPELAHSFRTPEQVRRLSIDGVPTPGSFLKSQRIRELLHESRNSTSSSMTSADESLSDETFQQMRDRTYKPKLNIAGMLERLNSKENSRIGSLPPALSLSQQFAQNLKMAAERFGDKDLLDTPSPMETRGTAFSRNQLVRPPLTAAVVYVSRKHARQQKELSDIVYSLGGKFLLEYADNCTHFVYQGRPGEPMLREASQARDRGSRLVAPEWLYACRDSGKWLDEAAFPSIHDERLSLSSHITAIRVPKQQSPTREHGSSSVFGTLGAPHHRPEGIATPVAKPAAASPQADEDARKRRLTESQQKIHEQLDELMLVAKEAGRRQSHRPQQVPALTPLPPPPPIAVSTSSQSPRRNILPLPDSESQFVGVAWDDPTRRQEMARLAANLLEADSPSQPPSPPVQEEADDVFELPEEEACPAAAPVRKFMLSGLAEEQRVRYAKVVDQLGGILLTSKNYDPEMTHLVLAQALKNERYLAAVAAGHFVLHTAYLDDSAEAGHFLDEEEYEWGGPHTDAVLANLSTSSTKSQKNKPAYAPRRWRQQMAQDANSKGAFSGWVVALFASSTVKEAVYRRVLEAGGAVVVSREPSSMASSPAATHALFDCGVARKVDLAALVDMNVLCLKAEYMASFLVDDPTPTPEKFLVEEVLPLLNSRTRLATGPGGRTKRTGGNGSDNGDSRLRTKRNRR